MAPQKLITRYRARNQSAIKRTAPTDRRRHKRNTPACVGAVPAINRKRPGTLLPEDTPAVISGFAPAMIDRRSAH